MRSEVSGRVGLCLQLGWMLSAADVISNVVPAAVGINVTEGLKVRTLSFPLAPFDKVPRGTLRRCTLLLLIARTLGSAANVLAC